MTLMFPRPPVLISQKIRDSAEGEECRMRMPWCDWDTSTTVLAHIRRFGLAGTAGKPFDLASFYTCGTCHAREQEAGDDDILRAHLLTLQALYEKGLIIVPDGKAKRR